MSYIDKVQLGEATYDVRDTVLTDGDPELSAQQKATARANLGAASAAELSEVTAGLRLTGTAEGNPITVADGARGVPCKVAAEIEETATKLTVTVTGINAFDQDVEAGGINVSTGANSDDASSKAQYYRSAGFIPVMAGETYFLRNSAYAETNKKSIRVYYYAADKTFLGSPSQTGANASRLVTMANQDFAAPVAYVRFLVGTPLENADGTISLNWPQQWTDFVPFTGLSRVEADLTEITGGSVSAGTVTFGDDGHGTVQVTGGQTYTFDHEPLKTWGGVNHVYGSAGDMEMTFARDLAVLDGQVDNMGNLLDTLDGQVEALDGRLDTLEAHFPGNGKFVSGSGCSADANDAHAEGASSIASGTAAHAEGSSEASGRAAHAEGEGTASGDCAHAEGYLTTASGDNAHAEGSQTIANHACQHVFGEFNEEDPSTAAASARGNYVEIVGNGTNGLNRSNARTLDWSGNEALAGSLTLGAGTLAEVTLTAAQLTQLLALLN